MTGTTLKYIRKTLNLTQSQLAKALGVAHSTVHRWELDIHKPNPEAQERLKSVFNYTQEDIEEINRLLLQEKHEKLQEKLRLQATLKGA